MSTTMTQYDPQTVQPTSAPENSSQAPQQTVRPRADIYEAEDAWFLVVEMPGVDENGTDISLEKNVLSITGVADAFDTEGFDRHYGAFAARRFERAFRLPEDVDTTAIEAHVRNGVLRLRLPKAETALPHKVTVKAG